ncbi:MAG: hypothetical protein R3C60_03495 [Parvularculaceae bacterium]
MLSIILAFALGYRSTALDAKEVQYSPLIPRADLDAPIEMFAFNTEQLSERVPLNPDCTAPCFGAARGDEKGGVHLTAPGLIIFNAKYPPAPPISVAVGGNSTLENGGGAFAPDARQEQFLIALGYPAGGGSVGGGAPPTSGPSGGDNPPANNGGGDPGPGSGGSGPGGDEENPGGGGPPVILPPMLDEPGEGEPPIIDPEEEPEADPPVETPAPGGLLLFMTAIAGFSFARRTRA